MRQLINGRLDKRHNISDLGNNPAAPSSHSSPCSMHSCFLCLTLMQTLCMYCSVNSWCAASAVHFILVFPRVPGTASCRKRRRNKYLLREWGGWVEEGKMHKVCMLSSDRAEAFLQDKGERGSKDLKPRVMMHHGKGLPCVSFKNYYYYLEAWHSLWADTWEGPFHQYDWHHWVHVLIFHSQWNKQILRLAVALTLGMSKTSQS